MGSTGGGSNGGHDRGGRFWDKRAERYDSLGWVNNQDLLDWTMQTIERALPDPLETRVLELGPGTGAMTERMVAAGWSVDAYELSEAMAERCRLRVPGADIMVGDWHAEKPSPVFDLVVARMVFRHDPNPLDAIFQATRWLRWNGLLVIVEGPPPVSDPSHPAVGLYEDAMQVKHGSRRETVFAWRLTDWMLQAGLVDVASHERYTHGNSLCEWLDAAQTPDDIRMRVVNLHLTAPVAAGEAYAMQVIPQDVLMRWRHCVVVGSRH